MKAKGGSSIHSSNKYLPSTAQCTWKPKENNNKTNTVPSLQEFYKCLLHAKFLKSPSITTICDCVTLGGMGKLVSLLNTSFLDSFQRES